MAVDVDVNHAGPAIPTFESKLFIRPLFKNRFCPSKPVTAIGIMYGISMRPLIGPDNVNFL